MKVKIATWEEAIKIGKDQNLNVETTDSGNGLIYGIDNDPDESGWGKVVSVYYSNGHYVYNGKHYPECFCTLVDGDTEADIIDYGKELICDKFFRYDYNETIEIKIMEYNNKLYYVTIILDEDGEFTDVMCKEIEYTENN